MEFLTGIEHSSVGTWVRESPSMFAYTGLIFVHAFGLAFTVGLSWTIALRILGVAPRVPLAAMEPLFPVIWVAFWVNVVSGVLLVISNATGDLTSPIFYTKMVFVALGAVSTRLVRSQVFGDSASLKTSQVPRNGRILAGAWIALWAGAIVAGRLTEYPQLFDPSYY